MPNYTENYKLKKPLPNENYNIQDQNDNMDIIDSELKKLDQKVENIEVPVTSVNGKTGDVELTADDVGAETPAGAQAKADAALNSAKQYTDQKVGEVTNELTSHKNDNTRHISPNIPASAITFGGKFQIAYNSATNSLDITVVS